MARKPCTPYFFLKMRLKLPTITAIVPSVEAAIEALMALYFAALPPLLLAHHAANARVRTLKPLMFSEFTPFVMVILRVSHFASAEQ